MWQPMQQKPLTGSACFGSGYETPCGFCWGWPIFRTLFTVRCLYNENPSLYKQLAIDGYVIDSFVLLKKTRNIHAYQFLRLYSVDAVERKFFWLLIVRIGFVCMAGSRTPCSSQTTSKELLNYSTLAQRGRGLGSESATSAAKPFLKMNHSHSTRNGRLPKYLVAWIDFITS